MLLKGISSALVCAVLLVSSGASAAEEYRPDQFLGLDLAKALLSPKPLGPPSQFAPVAVEAKTESKPESKSASATEPAAKVSQARAEPAGAKVVPHTSRLAHARPEKPHELSKTGVPRTRLAARTRVAPRHGNPLDAQALDTRIQVWPCKSGGICNWKPAAR